MNSLKKAIRKFSILTFITLLFAESFAQQINTSSDSTEPIGIETKSLPVIPSIITDRPDQTESPALVPKGLFQFETGCMMENVKSGVQKERNMLFNTSLLKYAVSDHLEFRLIAEYAGTSIRDQSSDQEQKISGLNPVLIGTKIFICEEKGLLPKISLISHLELPYLGAKEFRPTHVAPKFRFVMQHTLNDRMALSYNLGAEWDGNEPNTTGIYTLSLACAVTKKLGAFVESYGFVTEKSLPDYRLDTGFTYLLAPNFQVDASAGIGINNVAPDSFISCGLSWRIPK